MSRIGKLPIPVASGVEVRLNGRELTLKGSKGELSLTAVSDVTLSQGDEGIEVKPMDDSKRARSMWGMTRALIANMMVGVTEGFNKTLELEGVGYRAQMQGSNVKLALGFSHDVVYEPPQGIQIQAPKPTEIIVTGADKQQVGQVAAEIRGYRPPEPYKGKGVRYQGEYVRRKEGKKK